jgi:CheY-like chemotaxis protein
MANSQPIVVIEDDADDQDLLATVFTKLNYPNEILFFNDGQDALDYLNNNNHITPFLILSDINLPKLNGFALREKIRMDAELQVKCIPYLFFSTSSSQKSVRHAYSLSIQGFFIKQNTMQELEKTITVIMEYWQRCISPTQAA